MSTAQIKLELFRKIDTLEQDKLARLYYYLVKELKKSNDFWDELNSYQKADIEKGIDDLNKGRKKDFTDIMAKYK